MTKTTMKYVMLLRGINVGKAKRISMAQLRGICLELGWQDATTVLQSGNVVFSATEPPSVAKIQKSLRDLVGFTADILILPEAKFRAVANADPLMGRTDDPSRHIVSFFQSPIDTSTVQIPSALAPEIIELHPDAAYQWLPDGVLKTKLPKKFFTALPTAVTARNRRTVDKLLSLLD